MYSPVCPEDPSDAANYFLRTAASMSGFEDELFEAYDGRIVLWRTETRDGKPTKVPYQVSGKARAKSNAPSTWGDIEAARKTMWGRGDFEGLGIMLGDLGDGRFLVGLDLDLCRSPLTGEIMPWAMDWVDRWPSYIEVSPSGTGLKGYGLYTGTPVGGGKEITVDEPVPAGAEGTSHSKPEIGLYPSGRYFALTGRPLSGTWLELCDVTEAFDSARLEMDQAGRSALAGLPAMVQAMFAADPAAARAWQSGAKIGPGDDHSASGKDFSLGKWLKARGASKTEISASLRAYPHGQIGSGKVAGPRPVQRILDKVRATEDGDQRERIDLAPEAINQAARQCAVLLRDTVYLRGDIPSTLVRAGSIEPHETGGVLHAKDSLILTTPSVGLIQYVLDERAAFFKRDKPASCPKDLATRLIDAATELRFRQCTGIVSVPLFLGGEIVAAPGWHAPTGKIIAFDGPLPPIPEAPSKGDALAALAVLLEPFRGYLSDSNPQLRAGLAAAALTAVARPALPTAPALVLDANTAGAGKGKLARALAVLASGTLPAIITEGHGEAETEKRIASAILSGCQVILLDNLQNELASSTLESILTEGIATIRQFGKLGADITVPFSGLVIVTANNAALRADMLRRMLPIRIVIDTDEPEKRQFGFDPYLEAKRDRLQILAAAFTILRAWRNSGEKAAQTLGSFERWAELVAGAVQWLIGINPISLIEERKAEDPKRADERQVIAGLHAIFGEQKFTSKEAAGEPARKDFSDGSEIPASGLNVDLWRSVIEFKSDRPTPIVVGCWLREHKDKVFGDLRLTSQLDRDKRAHWSILKRQSAGDAGDCGGYLTPTRANSGAGADEGQGRVNELGEGPTSPAIHRITRTSRPEPEVEHALVRARKTLF